MLFPGNSQSKMRQQKEQKRGFACCMLLVVVCVFVTIDYTFVFGRIRK